MYRSPLHAQLSFPALRFGPHRLGSPTNSNVTPFSLFLEFSSFHTVITGCIS